MVWPSTDCFKLHAHVLHREFDQSRHEFALDAFEIICTCALETINSMGSEIKYNILDGQDGEHLKPLGPSAPTIKCNYCFALQNLVLLEPVNSLQYFTC
jgi:hypothetical protein